MNFPNSVKSGFRNYANFKGRASRSEFWWFILFGQVIQTVSQNISATIASLISLGLIIPNLSLQFRRLHDIGRSAKCMIWPLASLLGAVLAFVGFLMQTAQSISNFDSEKLFDNGMQFSLWMMIAFLVSAFIGGVVNLVFTLIPSDVEMNQYGPPPAPTTL